MDYEGFISIQFKGTTVFMRHSVGELKTFELGNFHGFKSIPEAFIGGEPAYSAWVRGYGHVPMSKSVHDKLLAEQGINI